jgi:hypothetical protein
MTEPLVTEATLLEAVDVFDLAVAQWVPQRVPSLRSLVERFLAHSPEAQHHIAHAVGTAVASALIELAEVGILVTEPGSSTPPLAVH